MNLNRINKVTENGLADKPLHKTGSRSQNAKLFIKVTRWLENVENPVPQLSLIDFRPEKDFELFESRPLRNQKKVHLSPEIQDNAKRSISPCKEVESIGTLKRQRLENKATLPHAPDPPSWERAPRTPKITRLATPDLPDQEEEMFSELQDDLAIDEMSVKLAAAKHHIANVNANTEKLPHPVRRKLERTCG